MQPSRRRLVFLIGVLIGLTGLVVVQLVRYQVLQRVSPPDNVSASGDLEPPMRGRIFDRNGELLAADEPRYLVLFDKIGADVNEAARDLPPIVGITPDQFRQMISGKQEQTRIARDLLPDVGKRVRALGISGVTAQAYWKRVYPEGTLAAHVLGFVNDGRDGYYGLEGKYNRLLNGVLITGTQPMVRHGTDLILTIDRTAQAIIEEELDRGLKETGAPSGSIIVMNPRTGEILAMASAPTFDPNRYLDLVDTDPNRFINQAVSANYEPGSIFKIITLAAALDRGDVTPESTYNDTACIEIGGQSICNWDRMGHGTVNMIDMMSKSLNVGAATLAMHMGQQDFYRYVRAFGIGRLTGIDLQAEAAGQLRTRETNPGTKPGEPGWSEADLGTNSFGQGVSATPIQMIAAVAAVANDGVLVQPHVVKQMIDGDQTITAKVVNVGRPISAKTAHTLTEVLVEVVNREVSLAQINGYRIAGKTGTAQIYVPGGYDPKWTIASFVGYGPASNPQLIILVKLDRPAISPWGSETAAPVFQRVATRLFAVLGIPPDDQQLALSPGQ
jgi:cell division protein FtsI/penicillin-binding protein 2